MPNPWQKSKESSGERNKIVSELRRMTGVISECKVLTDDFGDPVLNKENKYQVRVEVTFDRDVVVRKQITVAFGQSLETHKYAAYADLLFYVLGAPYGRDNQEDIDPQDCEGEQVACMVGKNAEGYLRIVGFVSGDHSQSSPQPPKPVDRRTPPGEEELTFDGLEEEVPF